jgi:excisionase family DNA binding protein
MVYNVEMTPEHLSKNSDNKRRERAVNKMSNEDSPSGLPDMATKRQLAEWAQCSTQTVERLVKSGKIPVVKVGRLVRFSAPDVRAALSRKDGS